VQGRPGYGRILHQPRFLILYRINGAQQSVEIVRIWDARQDPGAFRF
jgi:plasmid stabilization system protein ParE